MKKWLVMIGCLFFVSLCGNASAENSDPGSDATVSPSEIQSLRQTMLSDDEIMSMIATLKNDPDFIKALNDPELMRQINENNVEALKNNPNFLKLMDNQTVQRIEKKVIEKK